MGITELLELDCCPKCGGKEGFSYKLTMIGIQEHSWECNFEDDIVTNYDDISECKTTIPRCLECKKLLRQNI